MKLFYLLSFFVLSINPAIACDVDGKTGIMEDNSLSVPVSLKNDNGMTEELYDSIIELGKSYYEGIFLEEHGANLKVYSYWENSTVNAYADRSGNDWEIHMFGGLARHSTITPDAFLLVVCHEIAHHIGGSPRYSWWANEGQADYWASMKCMKRILENDDNEAIVAEMEIPEIVQNDCATQYIDKAEKALCERVAMSGLSLANLFASAKSKAKPDFATPDQSVVRRTFNRHPQAQCRLDTYYAGTLCERGYLEMVDNSDPNVGVCNREQNYEVGVRPLCWYKP